MITEKKTEPVLQYAILCDAIAKDKFGKSVYIGAFDSLNRTIVLPQFIISLKWICGLGLHTFKFNILNPELQILHTKENIQMQFSSKTQSIYADFPIINFNFDTPGVYWIEIFLNDKSHLSIPLSVHKSQS